jgi:hypothetical protein
MPMAEAVEQVQKLQREWVFCLLLLSRSSQLPLHQRNLANRVAELHARSRSNPLIPKHTSAQHIFGVVVAALRCSNHLNTFERELSTNHFRLPRQNGFLHSPRSGPPPPVNEDVETLHSQIWNVVYEVNGDIC